MNYRIERKVFISLSFMLFIIFSLSIISSIEQASTSVSNVQYFSPSTSSFSNSYGSLLSGVQSRTSDKDLSEQFIDMQVFIPPAGCTPSVVRSDLLEEQDVPIFCKLQPLKINPAINIQRIERISVSQKEKNDYISGVSFHPALAAISSSTRMSNNPSSDNIGYVVVVLRRQSTENSMPNSVNVTLGATLQYGGKNSFGIGESEFYLPVLSDGDFSNNYADYSFFDGIGYLRAEDVDENSAVISVYDSQSNKLFGDRIEKGKTSRDFYISTLAYEQGIRATLKEITIPQVKATIKVDEKSYEVYEGGKFYNNLCTLINIDAYGGSTGKVRISCPGKSFELEKQFGEISLTVKAIPGSFSVGEKVDEDIDNNYYLAYVGKKASEAFVFVVKVPRSAIGSDTQEIIKTKIKNIGLNIDSLIRDKSTIDKIKEIENSKFTYNNKEVLVSLIKQGATLGEISFSGLNLEDSTIDTKTLEYFNNALKNYDSVKDSYGSEILASVSSSSGIFEVKAGEKTLWNEYTLAKLLGQNAKEASILSRIMNEYPNSKLNGNGLTASELIKGAGMLSSSGDEYYYEKEGVNIRLVSVNVPS